MRRSTPRWSISLVGLKEMLTDVTAIRALVAEQKRALPGNGAAQSATQPLDGGRSRPSPCGAPWAGSCWAPWRASSGRSPPRPRGLPPRSPGGRRRRLAASSTPPDPLQALEDQGVSLSLAPRWSGLFPVTDSVGANQAAALLD